MTKKKERDTTVTTKKPVSEKVKFEFLAPDAHEVCLAGEFNNWDRVASPMKKDKKGVWKATLSLAPGRYQYRVVVDGCWENDPACADLIPNQFGSMNCVRTVG